ncbi:MAG: RNA pyrophosphohydrolase [Sphingomonas sp. 28-66-16]|nr:MAG: RNA pyrophosphohydrolase [Sphingomonas sp. 28-66-16]
MSQPDDLPYRPCAGMMIANPQGQLFVGLRIDTKAEAWQLPQGGIDDGEEAAAAALRELGEETGIAPRHVTLIAEAPGEYFYDLPPELIGRMWKGKWRGQRMRWFLYRFLGQDSDIDIATAHQEFRAWRWADPDEVIALAVPFKRDIYAAVFRELGPHLRPAD